MNKVKEFCELAISELDCSRNYGEDFCFLKMEFFRRFQNGTVFSTRFGADFFQEMLALLNSSAYIVAAKNEKLGEYDQNINVWLKKIYEV